jgi:hypothetical protein
MFKGWLLEGLRDAKREADAQPELRERVATHPSGFLREVQTSVRENSASTQESSKTEPSSDRG